MKIQACVLALLLAAGMAVAEVVVDFDDASAFTIEILNRTKNQVIKNVEGHDTAVGTSFSWLTDGTAWYQCAYLCYDLGGDFDFTNTDLALSYFKYNRSEGVGFSLWDDGQLVKTWNWATEGGGWHVLSVNTDEPGVAPVDGWATSGDGLLTSVDEVRFLHRSGTSPLSGYSYEVWFDSFSVVPEPCSLALIAVGGLSVWVKRRR